jgi:three-Cys-motif partner protein
MAQAKLVEAKDGFKARVAPIWSEEKLAILGGYLPAFAKATKGKAPGWYALDLFAGGGLNYSETQQAEIPGSPLIALTSGPPDGPEPIEVVMAEEDDNTFAALEHRTAEYGERAQRFPEDSNRVIDEMLARLPPRAPAFAFLDPEGSELDWKTVEAIAEHKRGHSQTKIEQLILFSDMGIARLVNGYPDYVTRVFGHQRWKPVSDRRARGEITAEDARTAYVKLYAEGLKELGYKTVLDRQITKAAGQPMYFLLFASDHVAGKTIMDNRFDRVRLRIQEQMGQGQLFPTVAPPRRKRLGES